MLRPEAFAQARTGRAIRAVRRRRAVVSVAVLALMLISASILARTAARPGPRLRHANGLSGQSRIAFAPHPYGGEPDLARHFSAPLSVRKAAIKFAHDYAEWTEGRLARLPARDATPRIIATLERRGRASGVGASVTAGSVRLASDGRRTYIVTSRAGNFIIGQRRARWVVESVPGD